jgi:hypothetical protein
LKELISHNSPPMFAGGDRHDEEQAGLRTLVIGNFRGKAGGGRAIPSDAATPLLVIWIG